MLTGVKEFNFVEVIATENHRDYIQGRRKETRDFSCVRLHIYFTYVKDKGGIFYMEALKLIVFLLLLILFTLLYKKTRNKVFCKLSVFWWASAFFEILSICPPPQDLTAEIVLKGICIVCNYVLLLLIIKDIIQQVVQSKRQKKQEE